jgi:hypothetical protein
MKLHLQDTTRDRYDSLDKFDVTLGDEASEERFIAGGRWTRHDHLSLRVLMNGS